VTNDVTDDVYVWCGRCGLAIEPEIRSELIPYCKTCREEILLDAPDLGKARLRSIRMEEDLGVPHESM